MSTNEQKLNQAKRVFESAAGHATTRDAVCLLGEGLALLTDALLEMNRDIERIKTRTEQLPK